MIELRYVEYLDEKELQNIDGILWTLRRVNAQIVFLREKRRFREKFFYDHYDSETQDEQLSELSDWQMFGLYLADRLMTEGSQERSHIFRNPTPELLSEIQWIRELDLPHDLCLTVAKPTKPPVKLVRRVQPIPHLDSKFDTWVWTPKATILGVFGESGSGKSLFVRNYLNRRFPAKKVTELLYDVCLEARLGDSFSRMEDLFQEAFSRPGDLLFCDDIEDFTGRRELIQNLCALLDQYSGKLFVFTCTRELDLPEVLAQRVDQRFYL